MPVKVETIPVSMELPGRVEASARVEVRARVKGFLDSVKFEAGQYVEEGQLLFTIEPGQFDAAVDTAKGNLAKAQADLKIAKIAFDRRKQAASGGGAVSELEVLSAEADFQAAQAAVDVADAALKNAQRDRDYCEIHAPIAGRISKSIVDQGNLVGAADPTLLATIVKISPVYVNFEFNERELIPYLNLMPTESNPQGGRPEDTRLDLDLILSDGSVFPEKGRIDFVNNSIDPGTGTIAARASFPNEAGLLADGLFARVRVPKEPEPGVRVPAHAVQRDLGGSYVIVVDGEGIASRRNVVPAPHFIDGMRIVEPFREDTASGLRDGERVAVSNLQKVRDGVEVTPAPVGGAEASRGVTGAKGKAPAKGGEPAAEAVPEGSGNGKG